MSVAQLSRTEGRAALSLAAIFALRMLGLFMIYPVFAVYAKGLAGATAASIGLALGIYGLAQAVLQIPFGTLSDRIGRKPVITGGLVLFAIGSVVAARATSIDGVIIGRALQGAGAIGSTVLALGADLTREENRTKAMALIGMTIGLSFALAVVVGPLLNGWVGVPGIFWLTALLALVGIAVLYATVPQSRIIRRHRDAEPVPALFKRVLTNGELLRLDFGIFAQHAILTATFLALPLAMKQAGGFGGRQWLFYLPILAVAFVLMTPFIVIGEKYRRMKPVFIGAVAAVMLGQLSLLAWHANLWAIAAGLLVFFAAFSLLEASLPSLISKVAPADSKGTAMGVYSSAQFLGIFVGGAVGGWVQGVFAPHGLAAVFALTTALAAAWLVVAATMPPPKYLSSRLIRVPPVRGVACDRFHERLLALEGVAEAVVVAEEGVAYLKVDSQKLDEAALAALAAEAPSPQDATAARST